MGKKSDLSFEEKIEIMYKYLEENKNSITKIKARTMYGDYPIGQWQTRMREFYYKGKLDIDETLESELLDLGILRKEKERQTAKKLTWDEKYLIMEEYLRSGQPIEYGTIYKDHRIGSWQTVIRHLYYTDSLNTISPELKKKFFEAGILKKEKVKAIGRGSKKKLYSEKFQIMYKYLKSTDFEQEIHQNTIFEGNHIGVWQDSLRQSYRKGRDLEISQELLDNFFTYGILREEDKKVRQTRISKTGTNKKHEEKIEQMAEELLRKQRIIDELEIKIKELEGELKKNRRNVR